MLSLLMSSPQAFRWLHDGHILGFSNCNVCSQLDKCKMKHKYLLICWKNGILIRPLVFLYSEADVYPAKGVVRLWNGLTIIACVYITILRMWLGLAFVHKNAKFPGMHSLLHQQNACRLHESDYLCTTNTFREANHDKTEHLFSFSHCVFREVVEKILCSIFIHICKECCYSSPYTYLNCLITDISTWRNMQSIISGDYQKSVQVCDISNTFYNLSMPTP